MYSTATQSVDSPSYYIYWVYDIYNDLPCTSIVNDQSKEYDDKEPSSSLLHIDKQFNIVLPTHNNLTIELEPMPKSLYILFLRHPEGIILKNIHNYRNELEMIYRVVSGRRNPTVLKRLITKITNPANNMLHKNLSIIRTTFTNSIGAEAADRYIPIRNRGREQYVKLESAHISLPYILQ